MASAFVSSAAEVVVIDSRVRSGAMTLPVTNSIPFRVLNFKDQYGTFSNSTFTLSTQVGESFDDGTTSKTFSNAFSYVSLYAVSSKWMVMNATQTVQQTISSLTVNQLTFGTGGGWVQFGPVQATVLSTIQVNTNDAYLNNIYVGTQSTINDLLFYGLFGNYNNTALAEISTGGGAQELLVFKGSSASDRVRVQTTGNFVVETGVSARLFNSNTTQTLSNITPAFIINTSSNVGIQTASPGATLDVAGTGRFQILSSLTLNVSSINGQPVGGGSAFTGSTTSLSAGTIFVSSLRAVTLSSQQLFTGLAFETSTVTSSLLVNGTGIAKWNGTNSLSLYGAGVDTFTLQTSCNSYVGGIASLSFAGSVPGYPLARIYGLDSAIAGSPVSQLVFQTVPTSATSFATSFTYSGAIQTFTVPAGVTAIQVTVWGAGGSGGGAPGGAGAFIQGILTVTPGQVLSLLVGQGGVFNGTSSSFGGGGATAAALNYTGSGGGRSAIQTILSVTISSASGSGSAITYTTTTNHGLQLGQPVTIAGLSPSGFNGNFAVASIPTSQQFTVTSTQSGSSSGTGTITAELLNIGGGGAGPENGGFGNGGAATFSGTAFAAGSSYGGGGGSQTSGGAAGGGGSSAFPTAGTFLQGGLGGSAGGGGGGGYYGGGGGGWTAAAGNGGGGGGSSYTSFTGFSITLGSNSPNSANQAPGTAIPGYISGVAAGGATREAGGNGLIVLNSLASGSITEAMRIGSNSYVGIGTTTPSYQLDVAGNARMSNIYIGTNPILTTQQFYGLQGNYNNTVLAEISTGGGTQELLVFKGSSTSDRVRVQTTGNFVVETGVSARFWSTNTAITASNITPAFIINTSSNVGIQTASPAATLDVAGTGRFQSLSTQNINLSTINGQLFGAPITSSIIGLASAGYISTSQLVSTVAGLGSAPLRLPSTLSTFVFLTSSVTASTIQTPQFQTDGNSLSIRYPFRDPSTTYFYAASTGYIGIGTSSSSNLLEVKDWTPSTFTNSLLSLQVGPAATTTFVASSSNYYYYTGTQQVYSIPSGTDRVGLRVYGAGGESIEAANPGGGGAYLEATLDVASLYAVNTQFSNLYIVVGTGGTGGSAVPSADFWTGNPGAGANGGWPAGGGFTGIFLSNIGSVAVNTCNNTPLLVAGAGGGGGYGGSGAGGAATWSGTAWSGNNNARTTLANGSYGGGGGSQTQGGTTGTTAAGGVNGSYLRGGTNVPGAGAGYFGGGGGYNGNPSGGGGGGSSWVSLSSFMIASTGEDAVTRTPGGLTGVGGQARSNSTYAGAGYGGVAGTSAAGSNGLVQIIAYQASTLTTIKRAMEIRNSAGSLLTSFTSDGRLAINRVAPDTGVSLDVSGTGRFQSLSTQNINLSTINGQLFGAPITSSIIGLASAGYISTSQLVSTVAGIGSGFTGSTNSLSAGRIFVSSLVAQSITVSSLIASTATLMVVTASTVATNALTLATNPSWILISPLQTLAVSTNSLWADQSYINTETVTTGNFSTMNTNALTLGTGGTWILTAPIQTSVISSIVLFANQPFFDTINVGSVSTMNSIEYSGLFGNYNNTVLAEISTGGGTQEFLVFKGSSASDRVRVQTTGNFVVETGVSARLFNSNTTQTLSNVTPAFIVNSSSNVGIQTANPGATLDVAGSGRFQTLSSLAIFASSIVAPYVFTPQFFTF
jgi:hypothetical protein